MSEVIIKWAAILLSSAGLFNLIGTILNRRWSISDKAKSELSELKALFSAWKQESDERYAKDLRGKLVAFADELINIPDNLHTEEQFNQIMEIITDYTAYCEAHPDFRNNKAIKSIELINRTYLHCAEKHNFLKYERGNEDERHS